MTKADVVAWVAALRHRNIARREERCMTCSNTPRLMKIEIVVNTATGEIARPDESGRAAPPKAGAQWKPDEQAIWWCMGCAAPAFGVASYSSDRKLDYSQLEMVHIPKRQQELF